MITKAVPVIMDQLAELFLSPDYFCEVKTSACDPWVLKPLELDSYERIILDDKPAYLQNNDFIDNLYAEIANDKTHRPTLSIV